MKSGIAFVTGCLAAAVALSAGAEAPGFPVKPIRVLSPSSPGGGADTITRAMTQKFNELTGYNAIVDNRSGANGVVAMNIAAQSAHDGYTLLAAGNLVVLNGVLKKVNYDIRRTFEPVVQMTTQPYFLVINPALPVSSVKELIAYAKARPGALSYGSSGAGSVIHLGTELFKSRAGIDMVHVAYKGNAPAFVDLISGQIQMLFTSGFGVAPHLKSGRLRAIAIASPSRLQAFPDLPTVAESGLPGFELENAYSVYAPLGVPAAVVAKLNREITRTMNAPDMKAKLVSFGSEAAPASSPGECRAQFVRQFDMWEKFLRTSRIKLAN